MCLLNCTVVGGDSRQKALGSLLRSLRRWPLEPPSRTERRRRKIRQEITCAAAYRGSAVDDDKNDADAVNEKRKEISVSDESARRCQDSAHFVAEQLNEMTLASYLLGTTYVAAALTSIKTDYY